jgi:hypothetical protein
MLYNTAVKGRYKRVGRLHAHQSVYRSLSLLAPSNVNTLPERIQIIVILANVPDGPG